MWPVKTVVMMIIGIWNVGNITGFQHSVIRGANFPITGRKATGYKSSPLVSYYPPPLVPTNKTIFCIDFSTGIPDDLGRDDFTITENGNLQFRPYSKFNGVSLYVPTGSTDVPYILSDLRFQRTFPLTLEAWVYLESSAVAAQRIISVEAGANKNYRLGVSSSGFLEFEVFIDTAYVAIAATTLAKVGEFFYVAGIYDGGNLKLFDGLTEYSAAQSGKVVTGASAVMFGASPGEDPPTTFNNPLRGYLAGAQMLGRTRTRSEVERYLIGV